MFPKKKTVRVVVFTFVIIGMCAFVIDVLNPATPTPLVFSRVVALAQLLLAALRILIPVFAAALPLIYRTGFLPLEQVLLDTDFFDILSRTCVQLR